MPSPIAHASVWFLARPLCRRWPAVAAAFEQHRVYFLVLIIGLLWWPDGDFILSRIFDHPAFDHGGATHSLVAGVVAAVFFASVGRWRLKKSATWLPLFLVGTPVAWSHALLDTFTYRSRGIALFWPFTDERIAGPALFYGVRHSEPGAWTLHLITLSTEAAFALFLWWLGKRLAACGSDCELAPPRR